MRVDAALLERLDKYVEATGIARSTVVRIATQKYLDAWEAQGGGNPPETLLPAAQTANASASASAKDEQARMALTALLSRTEKAEAAIAELQENITVVKKSTELNFGLIEGKADRGQFQRIAASVKTIEETLLNKPVYDALLGLVKEKMIDEDREKELDAKAEIGKKLAKVVIDTPDDDFASQF